jgi:hypothetical protein
MQEIPIHMACFMRGEEIFSGAQQIHDPEFLA